MDHMTASLDARPRKLAKPNALVMRCDECAKRVGRGGYLKVDRSKIVYEKAGEFEVLDTDVERVFWQILHADCDTDAKPTDYRMPAHLFSTTGDLLEATAYLLRNQPELTFGSNWHGLIGRILADTRQYAEWMNNPKRAEEIQLRRQRAEARQKRQGQLTDPNDPRHGTENGYTNCGCRCDRCRAAGTEATRRVRANRANRNGHNGADQLVCAERA
jgi:hypothetical protein